MKIEKKILISLIKQLDKNELRKYLEKSFDKMSENQRRIIFGEIYTKKISEEYDSEKLYNAVKNFYEKSVRGDYYDEDAEMNSKEFWITPEKTDEWFHELSHYLDESSNLVRKKEYEYAASCFGLLFDLIDKMEYGEEIIYAEEYGTWLISTNSDYNESYIEALSKVKNSRIFTETVIPLLERDQQECFSEKIFEKIKNMANDEQFNSVKEEIKRRGISVK